MAVNATMRIVAQLGVALSVSVIDYPTPTILNGTDVIIRLNASGICGSDLHFYHEANGSPDVPYLYGHEGLGVVTEVGDSVQFLEVGDYVVIPDNLDNGHWTIEPDTFHQNLSFSGPPGPGILQGLQAEYVRIPFADNSLIPIPANSSASFETLIDYLFVGDIFSTAWTGLTWSGFKPGDTVAVFGAGPVGLLTAYSAKLRGASKIYVVDHVESRLNMAASIGATPINFRNGSVTEQIRALEPNGVRRTVECVGYEAEAPNGTIDGTITLRNMVNITSPGGGMGLLGIQEPGSDYLTDIVGQAYNKRVSIMGGIVLPLQEVAAELVQLIAAGVAHPSFIVSDIVGIEDAPTTYQLFNNRETVKAVIRF